MRHTIRYGVCALVLGLCLCGCLKFPLGNPETSHVDAEFQGYWLGEDDSNLTLVALYPFDQHAYVLETFEFNKEAGQRKFKAHTSYKAWLTDVKNHTFLTLEPLTQRLAPAEAERAYPVVQISGTGDKREMRMVNSDFEAFANAHNPQDISAIITREVDNPKLYAEQATSFRRLDAHGEEAMIKELTLSQQ